MKAFFVASSVCFNPHPHAEGDVRDIKSITLIIMFQSTPSRGG